MEDEPCNDACAVHDCDVMLNNVNDPSGWTFPDLPSDDDEWGDDDDDESDSDSDEEEFEAVEDAVEDDSVQVIFTDSAPTPTSTDVAAIDDSAWAGKPSFPCTGCGIEMKKFLKQQGQTGGWVAILAH